MVFIREATESDIANIVKVENLSFPIPWSEDSIRHDVLDNDLALVLVAEAEEDFAGYLDIWCVAGEGQLNNIAVMPEFRGIGVGSALLEEAINNLRDRDFLEISLEVRPSNNKAIALYQKMGFDEVGYRQSYYKDDSEDALIYKLVLNEVYSGEEY